MFLKSTSVRSGVTVAWETNKHKANYRVGFNGKVSIINHFENKKRLCLFLGNLRKTFTCLSIILQLIFNFQLHRTCALTAIFSS